ncbi:hypothetical protein K474DRAFT_1703886 [Panus rudis PR-1116 ss-1]|nr:hypothetical protein K474DRAFT_1703886 [Panus rudis PR-1116 ss-1]
MSDALSQLGIDAAEAAVLASSIRTNNMIFVSILSKIIFDNLLFFLISALSLAILVYDTLLTFPQEVRCIWQRKWTGATLLYSAIRYTTIVDMAFRVHTIALVPSSVQGSVMNLLLLLAYFSNQG